MRVDGRLAGSTVRELIDSARSQESAGFDAIWTSESRHDPFLPIVIAAEHARRVHFGTAVAVAFARSPMTLAYTAADLQSYTGGRFILGLGSHLRAHVERRFSMRWGQPDARMREFVSALRAIWRSWSTHEPLQFRGEFYTHTLMTPFYSPPGGRHGPPRIFVGATPPAMAEVAGEIADGLVVHPFTTERYLREVTLPAAARGLATAGRDRSDVQIFHRVLVATGRTEADLAAATGSVRRRIAFYASIPSCREVLDLHGWGELAEPLGELSRSGAPDRWERMGRLVDDDMLETFAVVGDPEDVGARLVERFGPLVDRVSVQPPTKLAPAVLAGVRAVDPREPTGRR